MSSAALAKKRRAAPINNTPIVNNQPQQNNQPPQLKLTIPQALSILESRITKLELSSNSDQHINSKNTNENIESDSSLKEIINEYESRFELLINEINNIKDTVFKLQTFTMEVNKDMYENIKSPRKDALDSVAHEETVESNLETTDGTNTEEITFTEN
jgi:hypothetical protein